MFRLKPSRLKQSKSTFSHNCWEDSLVEELAADAVEKVEAGEELIAPVVAVEIEVEYEEVTAVDKGLTAALLWLTFCWQCSAFL